MRISFFCLVSGLFISVSVWAGGADCIDVNGSISANVVGEGKVLGTVTGDLKGATAATILKQNPQDDGSVKLNLEHAFVTMSRDTLKTRDRATWTPITNKAGVFKMATAYRIMGGTGKYANAKGSMENEGEVDTNTGLVTLKYKGKICGVSE